MNRISLGLKAISGAIDFNNLPKNQRQITFYSEGRSYWPHLKGLLNAVLEQTDKSICYVSSSLDDPGLLVEHQRLSVFYIGMGFVRDYFFQNLDTDIMVMTMPDLHNHQIKRSRHNVHYIYVPHSLVSLHMIYRQGAFDHFDTICAAGPHHVKEIRAIETQYDLPRKNVVELGYSRLDSLIKTANTRLTIKTAQQRKHKKILIAPSWGPQGVIESGLGKSLVDQLLNLGHEVILRPHPQTIKFAKRRVDDIRNLYVENSHFTFEDSVDGQESLYQCDIMVSDWSGVALEYAFALNKPVIFCDVPRKVNNPNYLDVDIEPIEVSIRKKIGIIWDGISSVGESIENCEQKNTSHLRTTSGSFVFNIGRSDNVFVKIMWNIS